VRRFFLVARELTATNAALLKAAQTRFASAALIDAAQLSSRTRAGDVVLGRLDVRPTLDGVEPGLLEMEDFEFSNPDVHVLNRAGPLLACHDKGTTALALKIGGVAHPQTECVAHPAELQELEPPLVVKPRLGSWGRDVFRCHTQLELRRCFREIAKRSWFQQHGALVQELVPPQGNDLRIVIAQGAVVGAIIRTAPPGKWRTNIALGATRHPVDAIPRAASLTALRAAAALDADLVGVDLLPLPEGGWVALELNGAVDFTPDYSHRRPDIFTTVIARLALRPDHAHPVDRSLALPEWA
jgi:[lysine-biosynthesis-protein LysW]---L-2-aminoadipate ligase